jgi:hypothetical protein
VPSIGQLNKVLLNRVSAGRHRSLSGNAIDSSDMPQFLVQKTSSGAATLAGAALSQFEFNAVQYLPFFRTPDRRQQNVP